jgi:gamma-glutamyltranspeptidase/glutathione hydrolase
MNPWDRCGGSPAGCYGWSADAAMAGLQMLLKVGNAFDAAIAVGTTLNMMEPQMNSIAGNGFMTMYDKKTAR